MSQAIAPKQAFENLRQHLDARRGQFAQLAGKYLDPARLIHVALSATSRQPLLLQCTMQSLLRSMIFCAEHGLEPCGAGGVWLVPFKNGKTQEYECTPITDWRGLVKLARRSGEVKSIEARVVHEEDDFDVNYGTTPAIHHRPAMRGEVGDPLAFYAVAQLGDSVPRADGSTVREVQFEVMTLAQVEAIRKRSRAGTSGPWATDFEQMACKTVVRRLIKYLPSDEARKALETEEEIEAEEPPETPQAPEAKTKQIARKLQARKETHPQPPTEENPPPTVDERQESPKEGDAA